MTPGTASWLSVVPWLPPLTGGILGASFGSFASALTWRAPRGISMIRPGSQCPVCHAPLTLRDVIPLVSYAINGARCRHCGAPISPRYPLQELVMAVCGWALFSTLPFGPQPFLALVALTLCFSLIVIRLERQRIPGWLLYAALAALVLAGLAFLAG